MMSEEQMVILRMLESGKLTSEEAQRLLTAVNRPGPGVRSLDAGRRAADQARLAADHGRRAAEEGRRAAEEARRRSREVRRDRRGRGQPALAGGGSFGRGINLAGSQMSGSNLAGKDL